MTVELGSLLALAVELDAAAHSVESVTTNKALDAAAALIKKDARAQIGHYQDATGSYPAWEPLAQSTEDEKARLGAPSDSPLYRFGGLQQSFRSDRASDNEVVVGSIDPVMDYHEFGTARMPPRPVVGPALYRNFETIEELVGGHTVTAIEVGQRIGYRFSLQEGGIPNSGFESNENGDADSGDAG